MATNPLGTNTRNITFNIPVSLFVSINRLANISGLSASQYGRALLQFASDRNLLARKTSASVAAWERAAERGDALPAIELEIVEPISEPVSEAAAKKTPPQPRGKSDGR